MQANFDLVIRGALTAHANGTDRRDVAIQGERIAAIEPPGTAPPSTTEIDGSGLLLLPGGVDPHVHFENPSWDTATAHDFGMGTEAAALGGTTTVIDFAFQRPGESPLQAVARRRADADPKVVIDYALHGTVTDINAASIEALPELLKGGFPSVKVFMTYSNAGWRVSDSELIQIMTRIREHGGVLLVHAENDDVVESCRHARVAAGDRSAGAHARSRPAIAEVEAIRRVLTFAEAERCPTYIVHLSTGAGLDAIREARRRGVQAYTETCPHYLTFDASALEGPEGARYVMSPPLRSADDVAELWRGLEDGSIDALGSDDAAYVQADKDRGRADFRDIPNGVPGVQVRTAVAYSKGVAAGRLSLERYVALVATHPARLFGLYPRKGMIAVGSDADLVLWEPASRWTGDRLHTDIGYTLYEGVEFTGRPRHVWSRGRLVVRDGVLVAARGSGRLVERVPGHLDLPPAGARGDG